VTGPATAFDAIAADYDGSFTATSIGSSMRRAVWARCEARFTRGARVLEMNCGTGEDALWLAQRGVEVLATDISPAMLRVAEAKRDVRRGSGSVRFEPLAWEGLAALPERDFDGALSNFGGLNCVQDLDAAARALASKLRPGAVAVLCVMGPLVPWEWAWFLARGRFGTAFRRLSRGTTWSGMTIRYPSISTTRRTFAPHFRMLRVSALGAFVPPPYTETWIGRHPRALAALERVERRCETWWPLPWLADHYVIELERTSLDSSIH
jgi:SAM-dependent methyltransferase